jgi:class 3 adenylate cyclase/tetratricopeptide (TPR) repeat protein
VEAAPSPPAVSAHGTGETERIAAAAGAGANPTARTPAPVTYTPRHLADQVLASKAALEGERKQVTVLFCDIVNSTATADAVGAETMHTLLNRFFETALTEVHRFEGTINQFLGDGFMALFGAPIAHEDHARRAVLAALALRDRMQEEREELRRRHGAELQVRLGLNTGLVVVGGIGDNLRMDYTAVGDTTNLAARLQSLAEPGTVLASEATYRLVLPWVKVEPLPPTRVKGKAEVVRPYKVLEARQRSAPGALRSRAPFVGRERELAVLQELWEQTADGHGQVVGITGEAGAGKSRLVYEFHSRLLRSQATWLTGRCLSYGTGIPYLPLAHMLRSAGGITESDPPAEIRKKLRKNLEDLELEPEEHESFLLRLLDVGEGQEGLADLEPQVIHNRTFATLRRVLFRASELRPVILEIEDLHWMDATSEEFVNELVERLPGARFLLLLTYRSGYKPGWMEKSYATQIPMRQLSSQDSRALVEAILTRGGLPPGLTDEILDKAEGNPFFLEELARALADREHAGETEPHSVPDTVQGLIMARMDRLPEEHKRVVQTAAVLGREFPLELLGAVWDQAAPLVPLVTDLQRWEFFYEDPTAEDTVCSFHHALTQEVAYQTLLTGRRRGLHRQAGEALERLHADRLDDALDRLAYHYPRAGEPDKAVLYLSRSAEKAARGYAHSEAARALRQALEQAEELPEEERDRRLVELALRLAESLLPLARLPETLELLEEHRVRLEQLGDDTLVGRFHFWLAHTHSYLGNPEDAAAHARHSIAAAERAGDRVTAGKAYYVLSRDGFWIGEFADGLSHGLRALELLEGERWWQGQAYWVNGFHHFVLGRFDNALESMERAREIGEDLADPRLDTSWSTGYFLAAMGDWEAGIAECSGGLERARDPLNTAAALGFLGYAYLEKGDQGQAISTLEKAVEKLREAGMQQLFGWFSIYLGEAYLAADRWQEAWERAEEGLETTRTARFRFGEALGERALGRIALGRAGPGSRAAKRIPQAHDPEEAERHLRRARERFSDLEAPFERARTLLDLARLARLRSRPEEAARHLATAREAFLALGATRSVEATDRLAAQLRTPAATG